MTLAPLIAVRLSLPPRALTPNENIHWRVSSEPRKEYREAARQAFAGLFPTPPNKVRMTLAFCIKGARVPCPHKRRPRADGKPLRPCKRCPYAPHDESNALSSFKAAQDGIASALGITDARKHLTIGGISIDSTRGPWVEVGIEVVA
jgi:hypothetical protein